MVFPRWVGRFVAGTRAFRGIGMVPHPAALAKLPITGPPSPSQTMPASSSEPALSPAVDSERLRAHRELLLEAGRIASWHRPAEEQARSILDHILKLLGAERAFLTLEPEVTGQRIWTVGRSADSQDLAEPGSSVLALIDQVRESRQLRTRSPVLSQPDEDKNHQSTRDEHRIIVIPLLWDDRLTGVLSIAGFSSWPTEGDLAVAIAVARQVAVAIESAQGIAEQKSLREENARLITQLQIKVDEIGRSRQQITTAEERLRREIAELLHSRVQTRLLLVWHKLGICSDLLATEPEQASTLLNEVRDEVDQIREQEIREASHLLHPSIIRVGLVPAVRSLTNRFEDYFRVSLQIDPRLVQLDAPTNNQIDDTLRLTAYRVLEEAFSNIYRHARANLVEISLQVSDENLLLITVRDNGQGFDPSQIKLGLGLSSIAGRVDQVGGTWEIEGAVDQGTTLRVRLPL